MAKNGKGVKVIEGISARSLFQILFIYFVLLSTSIAVNEMRITKLNVSLGLGICFCLYPTAVSDHNQMVD